jgi:hypothetical protein
MSGIWPHQLAPGGLQQDLTVDLRLLPAGRDLGEVSASFERVSSQIDEFLGLRVARV